MNDTDPSAPGRQLPAVTRVALIGGASLTAQCIRLADELGLEVVAVATSEPSVTEEAARVGATVLAPDADLADALRSHRVEALLSVAHLAMIPVDAIDAVAVAINFHDGRLPDYAGLDVTSWALWNGETDHEITWHLMTAQADAGGIIHVERFPIDPGETAFSLNARCYEAALTTCPRIVDGLRTGTLVARAQPPGERRLYRRHERPTALVDALRPATDTARAVRSLSLGHQTVNSMGVVRLVGPAGLVIVTDATAAGASEAPIGTVRRVGDSLHVRTVEGDALLRGFETVGGAPIDAAGALAAVGLVDGDRLPDIGAVARALADHDPGMARAEATWRARLCAVTTSAPLGAIVGGGMRTERRALPAGATDSRLLAAVAVWSWRLTGASVLGIDLTDGDTRSVIETLAPLVRPPVATVAIDGHDTVSEVIDRSATAAADALALGPFLADVIGRDPVLRGRDEDVAVRLDLGADLGTPPHVDVGRLLIRTDGSSIEIGGHSDGLERVADQIVTVLGELVARPDADVASLKLLGPRDRGILERVNATARGHDRTATVDRLVLDQVARTPDAPAVTADGATLTYRELADRSALLAERLRAAGVRPGDRVGICVGRTVDLSVALLAVLGSSAAYVPLDPAYPADRLAFMVGDSGLRTVIADGGTRFDDTITVVPPGTGEDGPVSPFGAVGHGPDDLAYVIYTSGSTGTPKGVMLEHRNVVNFFAAMDDVIDHDPPGTWLAVTSLSFDISVLELLWTLTRGFHVVLQPERTVAHQRRERPRTDPDAPPTSLSLFYFAAGEAAAGDGYRLLLESARFADEHGFEAVWTPERHFHEFGGAYPNPSVTGAALAAVTERIAIRAGSVVAPLHNPARIAEEWAVVDNLSGGRVGISFAAGWQPNDFVLNPTAFAGARDRLPDTIDTVRALWRGESIELPGHDGTPIPTRTLPRPVQAELPVWLTSAGSPATFEQAGRLGHHLLTHLLGQSLDQLADNIARYRAAWTAAGHAGRGQVTLMLHTYLHEDRDVARRTAHDPLKGYLSTATGLIKNMASSFPTFARGGADADEAFRSLTADELDQLLEMAADRYLDTSGLFGTVDDAVEMIERCSAAGADEIACLIDFGIATDDVLASLPRLGRVADELAARRAADAPGADPIGHAATFAELAERHGATHLQCTPSLATMLLADPADRAALAGIDHVMLGGEALPTALADELRSLLPGRFTNMYGPTETTIWSLVHEIETAPDGPVPIGRPIANTTLAILDPRGRELPVGAWGELHLGGEGVARGYHDRPELTAERFVDRPGLGRTYATGDVARLRPDGVVEFAGRSDHQVKIRGHRIELGEIETVLDRHPAVVHSVVVAHQGAIGDPQLIAFLVTSDGDAVDHAEVRELVGRTLPDAYVPARVVRLEEFPLTPNGKTDRGRLLADLDRHLAEVETATIDLDDDLERSVAEIWARELGVAPSRDDNFFDIGGNSLMAVTVFRRVVERTGADLALTDVFRHPTVRSFAAHVAATLGAGDAARDTVAASTAPSGVDRGELRRRARGRR